MKSRDNSPLYHLCFKKQLSAGRRYTVTVENAPAGHDALTQTLDFFPDEYRVAFLHPRAPFAEHLEKHEGNLKKVLSTAMKAVRPEEINFPFIICGENRQQEFPEDHVRVYTDGSLSPAGTGGWAGVCIELNGTETEHSGHEPDSSSNRMELMAVTKLLEHLPDNPGPVVVYTDSRYVIRGARMWLNNWMRNGFMTALNRPVKNRDLWEKIQVFINIHEIYFSWISSQSGDPFHARCDARAREVSLYA